MAAVSVAMAMVGAGRGELGVSHPSGWPPNNVHVYGGVLTNICPAQCHKGPAAMRRCLQLSCALNVTVLPLLNPHVTDFQMEYLQTITWNKPALHFWHHLQPSRELLMPNEEMLTEHVIIDYCMVWSQWNDAHNYNTAWNYWVKVENEFTQQFNLEKLEPDTHVGTETNTQAVLNTLHTNNDHVHCRRWAMNTYSSYTHTQHVSIQTGEQASFCWRENGKCEGRDEGDKCPPGPWGYPNGVIHHPSQSHAEQSCQCMNAALLLSAILIMAPVTALINTITSHWKSLIKTLGGLPPYQQLCTAQTVSYAKSAGWMGGSHTERLWLCSASLPLFNGGLAFAKQLLWQC